MNEAAKIVPQFSEEVTKRFWSKVDRDGPVPDVTKYGDIGCCWVWTAGFFNDGYGAYKWNGQNRRTHRFSWMLHYGHVRDGLWVLHRCDNPACVRVDHLWLGTSEENTADRHAKGRSASGDKNGSRTRPDRVRRGEKNGTAILTEAIVLEIRRMAAEGILQTEISRALGVKPPTVSAVVNRRNWHHIP
jgi:hypothetical protein